MFLGSSASPKPASATIPIELPPPPPRHNTHTSTHTNGGRRMVNQLRMHGGASMHGSHDDLRTVYTAQKAQKATNTAPYTLPQSDITRLVESALGKLTPGSPSPLTTPLLSIPKARAVAVASDPEEQPAGSNRRAPCRGEATPGPLTGCQSAQRPHLSSF
jgi:hypothetical protein